MSHLVIIVYPDQYRAAEIIATVQRVRHHETPHTVNLLTITYDMQGNLYPNRSPEIPAGDASASDLTAAVVAPIIRSLHRQATTEDHTEDIAFLHALGVSDWFLQQLHVEFTVGTSAIIHLTPDPDGDTTLMEICKFSGIVLQTSLVDDAERQLRQSIARQGL
jgi:uncharacterized membrane protein